MNFKITSFEGPRHPSGVKFFTQKRFLGRNECTCKIIPCGKRYFLVKLLVSAPRVDISGQDLEKPWYFLDLLVLTFY